MFGERTLLGNVFDMTKKTKCGDVREGASLIEVQLRKLYRGGVRVRVGCSRVTSPRAKARGYLDVAPT